VLYQNEQKPIVFLFYIKLCCVWRMYSLLYPTVCTNTAEWVTWRYCRSLYVVKLYARCFSQRM